MDHSKNNNAVTFAAVEHHVRKTSNKVNPSVRTIDLPECIWVSANRITGLLNAFEKLASASDSLLLVIAAGFDEILPGSSQNEGGRHDRDRNDAGTSSQLKTSPRFASYSAILPSNSAF